MAVGPPASRQKNRSDRGARGRFMKGQSGNPASRSPRSQDVSILIAQHLSPDELVASIASLVKAQNVPAVRLACEYMWSSPPTQFESELLQRSEALAGRQYAQPQVTDEQPP